MKITAEPRSDQWNAEDFLQGPRVFAIAGVKNGAAEQKYDIDLAGESRVWRPPLTMLRVLLTAWGDDSDAWVGRRVQLFHDPNVRFGKEAVGGIRIAALSHLDGPLNLKLTATRGKRVTYTVQPLPDAPALAPGEIPELVATNTAKAAADGTIDAYHAYLAEQGAPAYILEYVNNHSKENKA
ncbi:hypothetical protein [Pseudarthrobacter sp. BRE9]|uniref:hypothetical protein n=1 Tax=Pseudarthrobacter sp. BRE9 TaxID=2962582 RepID=UPI002881BEFC|nr:hypothetical protein [Pseudarthrobacter sp. BRE9]MDT0171044.1 hypothetical protein [Pseudarthrobacter sp. BRE9]